MIYGTKFLATKKQHIHEMCVTKMKMLRWICGKTKKDWIWNEYIH